jgi:cyclopropane fatty-acyl-phospholipid synthase-like methyltransferase
MTPVRDVARDPMPDAKAWWNRAAQEDARWYIATTSDPFFERGRRDADELVAFCGLQPSKDKTLLEIGAGAGRMTHRFAQLYGRVIALDVSEQMLRLGWGNLTGVDNIEWVIGSGVDLDVIPDRSVDDVFSYITLQHVPSAAAVLRYLEDASRVLRQGGQGALQVRRPGVMPRAVDLAGHLVHAARGRRVWAAEWRGTRIPVRMLLQAASRSSARVELRPRGQRHLWVLLWR